MIIELILGFSLGFGVARYIYHSDKEACELAMKEFAQDLAWQNSKAERMAAIEEMDRIDKFYARKDQELMDDKGN